MAEWPPFGGVGADVSSVRNQYGFELRYVKQPMALTGAFTPLGVENTRSEADAVGSGDVDGSSQLLRWSLICTIRT